MFINKEQVKRQCRIELDDNNEDVLPENYIATAEQKTIAHLNRNLYKESVPETDPNCLVINAAIVQGMLLLVTGLYEHRGGISDMEQLYVFPFFKFLVNDYRLSGL
ncbi:head-tail connector protein [Candidatus Symbiopectobacterium endolongispinus]|uniref:head-tail connector protein n=1 Tax=Candidatus Symbiopectobacterium endolongispinus TaxID=2812664 RepID=UPI00207AC3BF|nr:head-tail connector protein [Candidatus Symbiopectobacterium endolongispinus]MBT9428889.1 phage gp6-like head-tail connector protein [Candidatus Symbiopectobacterium endolongispinus]